MGADLRRAVLASALFAAFLSAGCRRHFPADRLQPFDEKISALQERLDVYPPDIQYPDERERLTGELGGLIQSLEEALKQAPNDPELEWRLGECHRMGYNLELPDAWKQSQAWLKRALRHDSRSVPAHETLGFLYVDTGQEWAPAAEQEFLDALRFSREERPDSEYGLFYAELNQGKLEEALQAADRYLESVPDDREFRERRDEVQDELDRQSQDSIGDEPAPPVRL